MKAALLVVDVQNSFSPPKWLTDRITTLLPTMMSVATVERHDESEVPFQRQLGWVPGAADECLVDTDYCFVKHGYLPPPQLLSCLKAQAVERVFVCGLQAETCVLAAGFVLFDAGLHPTIVADMVLGSSLDPSGALGVRLWRHHFGSVLDDHRQLLNGRPNVD
jgi:nicotinamidase-related amidase